MVVPITGPQSPNGKDARDAFNLYLDSIHDTASGRKIEVTVADGEGQAATGLAKTKQLVENDGAQVLTGYVVTPVCRGAAIYVQQAHVPLILDADCAGQALTLTPQFASPYLNRFTQTTLEEGDTAAAWAYKAGYRKAIILSTDFAAGIDTADLFASAFIARGGTVVQELHSAVGTTDFGPYLTELDKSADLLALFVVGADPLRFGAQYGNYIGQRKLQVLDMSGVLAGADLHQLGDKILGVIADSAYSQVHSSPENKAFLQAWQAKYPGRDISEEAANGYTGAEAMVAAIDKVHGNVEDKTGFLNAIHDTKVDSVKGPISLDSHHDIVENRYFLQVVKAGNEVGVKQVDLYPNVGPLWDRTLQQLNAFKPGTHKGEWVGMTKDKLGSVITVPVSG